MVSLIVPSCGVVAYSAWVCKNLLLRFVYKSGSSLCYYCSINPCALCSNVHWINSIVPMITRFLLNLQPWQTPANKLWPGSARADEIHGDRNVVATLYGKLVPRRKDKKWDKYLHHDKSTHCYDVRYSSFWWLHLYPYCIISVVK